MRTKLILIVAALIAAGAAALSAQHLHATTEAGQAAVPPPAVPVVAGTVHQGDVPIYLRGVGTVIAYNNVIVRSQITGTDRQDRLQARPDGASRRPAGARSIRARTRRSSTRRPRTAIAIRRSWSMLRPTSTATRRLRKRASPRTQLVETQKAQVAQLQAMVKSDEALIEQAQNRTRATRG